MNADRLLQHYEQIADAPDAIARLRRFVLDLAVRGKLVLQDPKDEPASELLRRIAVVKSLSPRKERAKGREEGLSKGGTDFPLPVGWASAPFSDLVAVLNGRAYKQQELLSAGVPVLRVGNLFTSDKWYYSDLHLPEDKYCDNGDLIFAWSASFGPFIWSGERVVYHYHIWKLVLHSEADLSKLYLYNFLLQKTREIKNAGHGISMIHMTKEKMEQLSVPLPPLAEQHRIVAKVDELMALCDQLEAARTERETKRDRLAAASLARLNTPDPETFRDDARFALDALPALTARPDQIKQLRQTILNLAVRGKLVAQDPADEPSNNFLKRIQLSKARSRKPTAEIDGRNIPYDIPKTWNWVTLEQILVFGPQNGISPRPTDREDAPKAITLTATTSGTFNPAYFKRVDGKFPPESDFWLSEGDLLFQRGNTPEYVGMAAVYHGPPQTFLFPDLIIKVRVSDDVDLSYVHLASVSPSSRQYLTENASGAQATMPKINQTTLLSLPISVTSLPLASRYSTRSAMTFALIPST
ncbi:restriction endonuclease subunit S [Agrobacterium sp.]|uniref:restriction endonuclease subunit S n=1 Tax=Agrobacterium sp. TaxID=361 RepID=UPI0025C5C27D|nr:restriction endonuclease subunit S [Agrobacterium sp.]MCD4660395.1 restriction endonuclease subunit S [Agrobacterium sp.]